MEIEQILISKKQLTDIREKLLKLNNNRKKASRDIALSSFSEACFLTGFVLSFYSGEINTLSKVLLGTASSLEIIPIILNTKRLNITNKEIEENILKLK